MLATPGARMLTAMTQHTPSATTLKPHAVSAEAGEAWWWMGSLAIVKATAADTGGQVTILDSIDPPDTEMPLHVHHHEDEAFWILEGSATFEIGDRTIEAGPGDYLFGPRDVPHRYTTGPGGCRMLFVFTPGGFEEFVRATSTPAQSRTLPPPPDGPPSEDEQRRIRDAIRAHGCEVLE